MKYQNFSSLFGMMLKFPTIFHNEFFSMSVRHKSYSLLVDRSLTAKYRFGPKADFII
jgi:hypothetical protein